jgi:hypothetical protein
MQNIQKTGESHVKLAAPQLPADIRTGGENVPLEYPHLYQIQAGDWRISYAVENNRLAILVLEVLGPDGESSKDTTHEKMTKKMKVKLLDWPEGSGNSQVPPEVLSKKLKIKWLDLADEAGEPAAAQEHTRPLVKLMDSADAPRKHRITLLDTPTEAEARSEAERPTTPLNVTGM